MACKKPVILVIGSTGTNGRQIVANLEKYTAEVTVRYSARRQEQVDKWRAEKKDAVFLDLDDPRSFGPALHGVDRIMLITGYTVAMLVQCKTLIDAARKAGVKHVVHLGAFTDWDTTDPHFAWHVLIDTYLKASGMKWTILHPNVFMENILVSIFNGALIDYYGGNRVGWIAADDIAKVAASVLREGPCKHHEKEYWLSTESLSMKQVVDILSTVTGGKYCVVEKSPDDFTENAKQWQMEQWYAGGIREFFIQIKDGRMANIGAVRNDVPFITGEPALRLKEWATKNKDILAKLSEQTRL